MSRISLTARWGLLQELIKAAGQANQPQILFSTLERTLAQVCGHKLFTLMILHPDSGEAERVYTSNPEAYPVLGRKQMTATPWFRQVIVGKQHYLGTTDADIRWAFADHELIKKLGCGSIINVLVTYNNQVLGTANLLHQEHHYQAQDIADCLPFVQLLAAPFIAKTANYQQP